MHHTLHLITYNIKYSFFSISCNRNIVRYSSTIRSTNNIRNFLIKCSIFSNINIIIIKTKVTIEQINDALVKKMDNMHVYLICYYNINNKSSLKTDN